MKNRIQLEMRSRRVGPWSLNAYVLVCPETRQSVLVDPGAAPDRLEKLLEGTRPKAILITHSHPDHIGALSAIRQILKVPVMAHPGEDAAHSPIPADQWLAHGDELSVGSHVLRVYHTPGHSEDQVCFAVRNSLDIIVGDTLFEGGPGKTWSSRDFHRTLDTLRSIVLSWPDEVLCHPGHGPHFKLGDKRQAIERFLMKDHGGFYGDATWGM